MRATRCARPARVDEIVAGTLGLLLCGIYSASCLMSVKKSEMDVPPDIDGIDGQALG